MKCEKFFFFNLEIDKSKINISNFETWNYQLEIALF